MSPICFEDGTKQRSKQLSRLHSEFEHDGCLMTVWMLSALCDGCGCVPEVSPGGHLLRGFCPRLEMTGEVSILPFSEELVQQTGGLPFLR